MHQKSNEQDMLRQFNMECQSSFPERELLNSIALQLINKGSRVTHKSLILQILTELELEKDNKKRTYLEVHSRWWWVVPQMMKVFNRLLLVNLEEFIGKTTMVQCNFADM
ncbi:hypothetical protein HA45_12800 [Pantoea rodasii]|uniref:biofilm development regulator YmgB/AriR family protein n=1 Tax=Pantoea rodasii TaxID=1076549 RepID=UPI000A24D5D4|nr:biofilm development regulator YmgB/AriR family protein [Pantoea rodasii]ORM63988.1 hypothetical protein HA45_12800 [Pantoea rodasii]